MIDINFGQQELGDVLRKGYSGTDLRPTPFPITKTKSDYMNALHKLAMMRLARQQSEFERVTELQRQGIKEQEPGLIDWLGLLTGAGIATRGAIRHFDERGKYG